MNLKKIINQKIKGIFKKKLKNIFKIEEEKSLLVDKYLKNLKGIEIGASSYRNFGLDSINVDISDNSNEESIFSKAQIEFGGYVKKVDIVARGDELPFEENSWDFVLSSHVLEHIFDPIKALKEWHRVIKPQGYICIIIPDKRRTFDRLRPRTKLNELIRRHSGEIPDPNIDTHHNVWVLEDILELCKYLNYNVIEYMETDTKVHDGFTVIVQK